jgi:NADP-dependent alcohol dehydrogenase
MSCAVHDDVVPDPDFAAVTAAVEAIGRARAHVVIAIGGGSVLDVAKTAAWAARNPQLLRGSGLHWRGGLARREEPSAAGAGLLRPPLATVMLATTLGTGAEVSAVACLSRVRGGEKLLLIDRDLQPSVALLDPALTRTLPQRLCLQGGFETLARLLIPYLTDAHERPLQDAVTFAIMRTIVKEARRVVRDPANDQARLSLALCAVASHVAWANTGRPVGGHPLWYIANPLSPAASVDKVSALAALSTSYLDAVCRDAHQQFGRSGRLGLAGADILGTDGTPVGALAGLANLLDEWSLPRSIADLGAASVDPSALAATALSLWGDDELLGAVPSSTLQEIYRAASTRWLPSTRTGREASE